MTQTLGEPQSVGNLNEREVSPPVAGPGRIEPPTHPAVPRLNPLSSLRTGRLRFAPAPGEDADRPAAPARPSDRAERVFEAGWISLVVACAAECAWRLL